jgi:hypothetical protein
MNKVHSFLLDYKEKFNASKKPLSMNVNKTNANVYHIRVKNSNGATASLLRFTANRNQMYIVGGFTKETYEKRGLGTLLRALATQSGAVANSTLGLQYGTFERRAQAGNGNIPNSSKIMKRLGWRVNNNFTASFIYNKNNISKVKNYINRYLTTSNKIL